MSPPWGQNIKFKVRALPDRFLWNFLASEAGKAASDLSTSDGDRTVNYQTFVLLCFFVSSKAIT